MKRLFDFSVSMIALVIFSPLFVLVAILVRFKLGAPVLFKQLRPGFREKPFIMYKFRSLTNEKDKKGNLLPDHLRFSRFSRLLRQSRFDELPELINVIKGDMSLVGPRPLLMQYLERYDAEQSRRHHVKPGITGWAQVNGRNAITWEEKFKLDVWYVRNHNFWIDLRILFLTIFQMFKQEGIQQDGQVTAEEFMGNVDHEY